MDLKRAEHVFVPAVLPCRAMRMVGVGIEAMVHQLFFSGVGRRVV